MIIHIDMDAFYASVEELDQPALRGRPVIVGGSPEARGVVSAANYVARQFGVHSAMPMSRALRQCPKAVHLPVRMARYVEVSRQIHEVFARYTPEVEPLSLDEAFLDVAASERLYGSPEQIGRRIKQAIRDELGLVASVGVAANKFIAKIASDIDKPDGFKVVPEEQTQTFLDPLPVSRLWGVGKATHQVFERLGIQTIKQVRQLPEAVMQDHFGQHGSHLWLLAQGIDERRVVSERRAKSISNETTFAHDISDSVVLLSMLMELTEQVASRLRHAEVQGRTVQLKLRFSDFKTLSRSLTLEKSTQTTEVIWQTVRKLFDQCRRGLPVRLLGVGISNLSDIHKRLEEQTDLFATIDPRQQQLDQLADTINNRFGKATLHRGSSTRRNN